MLNPVDESTRTDPTGVCPSLYRLRSSSLHASTLLAFRAFNIERNLCDEAHRLVAISTDLRDNRVH